MNLHRTIFIQEELERRILHGLSCEWDLAVQNLSSPASQKRPQKPLFRLQDMKSRWAYWDGGKKVICFSRDLVLGHSWDSVREILLHEIAHQITEEILGCCNETPHGPVFQKACALLRANPGSSGKCRLLDEKLLDDEARPKDKIMLRIRKLMALAQSSNAHEAESAMAKAHQMIKKYNVDLLGNDDPREFVSIFLGKPALRHFQEHYRLSRLLQEFYFVFCIWVPAYMIDKGKMGNVLEITGTVRNVKIACYVYDFVQHYINAQWNKYNKVKAFDRYRKTDFAVGVIKGFGAKLQSQNQEHVERKDKMALISLEDKKLEEYVVFKYPRISRLKGKAIPVNRNILNDGMEAGRQMIISKGIEERGRERGIASLIANESEKCF